MAASSSPYPFLHVVEKLKGMPRKGWVQRGIPEPESVSGHMHRMAIMILMLPKIAPKVRDRALMMTVIHDLAEAIVGDLTPADGVSKEEKHIREELAFQYFGALARPEYSQFADGIKALWEEYEEGKSEAAILCRSVDALECLDQALIYARKWHRPELLTDFESVGTKIQHPQVVEWYQKHLQEVEALRTPQTSGLSILFVIGGPGSGKGTQCDKIAVFYDSLHLSVGDLLREEANDKNSFYSEFINASIKNSVIIPANLTLDLIDKKCKEMESRGSRFLILDGFPRSMEQIQAFEEKFPQRHATISLKCSEAILIKRLQARSLTSGRADDTQESILKRLRTWKNSNEEIIEHLRHSTDFHEVHADGSVEDVFQNIEKTMSAISETRKSSP